MPRREKLCKCDISALSRRNESSCCLAFLIILTWTKVKAETWIYAQKHKNERERNLERNRKPQTEEKKELRTEEQVGKRIKLDLDNDSRLSSLPWSRAVSIEKPAARLKFLVQRGAVELIGKFLRSQITHWRTCFDWKCSRPVPWTYYLRFYRKACSALLMRHFMHRRFETFSVHFCLSFAVSMRRSQAAADLILSFRHASGEWPGIPTQQPERSNKKHLSRKEINA